MKEDKENTRPKERRGAPAGPGAAPGAGSGAAGGSDGRTGGTAELERLERPKDKKETLSKVRPGPNETGASGREWKTNGERKGKRKRRRRGGRPSALP